MLLPYFADLNQRIYLTSKRVFFLLKTLIFILVITANGKVAYTDEKVSLRIGAYENRPKIYTDSSGKITGFWPELIRHIAQKEKWEITYIKGSWNECLERLLNGEIDVMPDLAFTEKRGGEYVFTKHPVLMSWSKLYTQKDNADIKSITDLEGKKIAVLSGSVNFIGDGGIKEMLHNFNINCTFEEFKSYNKVFEAVENNQVDAGVSNINFGNANQEKHNLSPTAIIFQPVSIKFGLTKKKSSTQDFVARINHNMENLTGNNNSIYYQLLEQYFETGIAEKKVEVFPEWIGPLLKAVIILFSFLLVVIFFSRIQVKRKTRELKLKNKALQDSEERFRSIVENSQAGYFFIGSDGIIKDVNDAWIKMYKYSSSDEIIGHHFAEIQSVDDIGKAKEFVTGIMQGDNRYLDGEFSRRCKDGSTGYHTFTARPVIHSGKTIGIEGFLLDSTKRKQTERELLLKNIVFDTSIVANSIADLKGNLNQVNDSFVSMWGYKSKSEVMGKPILHFIQDREKAEEIINSLDRDGKWVGEYTALKNDGSTFIANTNSTILYDETGKKVGYQSSVEDITDRKKVEKEKKNLEENLIQAQKMETIGILAGGIAHDFNNILFPILGHAEMLSDDISNDSPLSASLNAILTSALRAKDLVRQILTFSRQEKGELQLMKIQPVIKEVLKLIRSTIPTTIKIKQDIESDCGVIKADPIQIHQIIMNIATNAYHAMEGNGGKLTVKLKEVEIREPELINPEMAPGLFACLTISDKGIGMNPKLKNKIFDPFFTTKKNGKGTGMGLSVVHGIVTSMQGGIQVISEPGKGTTFRVYFPIEKNLSEQRENTIQSIQGGTEHVLLVDDEKAIINMEKKVLGRLGYKVSPYANSIEALEAFKHENGKFDIVITDYAMPDMAGDRLASEILKINPDIPIILNTGFSDKLTPEIAYEIGIKGILMKPVIMSELSKMIRKVLDD